MIQRILLILFIVFPIIVFSQEDSTGCSICKNIDELRYKIVSSNENLENELSRKASIIHSRVRGLQAKISGALAKLEKSGVKLSLPVNELNPRKTQNLRSYFPLQDSLSTYFKFCLQNKSDIKAVNEYDSSTSNLKNKLNQLITANSKLEQQLSNLENQTKKIGIHSPKILRQLSECSSMLKEANNLCNNYEAALGNASAIENTILNQLKNSPVFGDFFSKHSGLAGMFGNSISMSRPTGNFQSRNDLMQMIKNQFGSLPSAENLLKEGLSTAAKEIRKQKDSIEKSPRINSNFNKEKHKIKIKPLFSFQANGVQANSLVSMPKVFDIGAGFLIKIKERQLSGAAISYKLGVGENIEKIKFTNEGFGARCFLDWRLAQSSDKPKLFNRIFITGLYELNYWKRFHSVSDIDNRRLEKSLYAGLTKWTSFKDQSMALRILYKIAGTVNTVQSFSCRLDFSF